MAIRAGLLICALVLWVLAFGFCSLLSATDHLGGPISFFPKTLEAGKSARLPNVGGDPWLCTLESRHLGSEGGQVDRQIEGCQRRYINILVYKKMDICHNLLIY